MKTPEQLAVQASTDAALARKRAEAEEALTPNDYTQAVEANPIATQRREHAAARVDSNPMRKVLRRSAR